MMTGIPASRASSRTLSQPVSVTGAKDDIVHVLLDEGADGLELVFLLLPGVVKQQLEAVFLAQALAHGLGVGHAPVRFRADL